MSKPFTYLQYLVLDKISKQSKPNELLGCFKHVHAAWMLCERNLLSSGRFGTFTVNPEQYEQIKRILAHKNDILQASELFDRKMNLLLKAQMFLTTFEKFEVVLNFPNNGKYKIQNREWFKVYEPLMIKGVDVGSDEEKLSIYEFQELADSMTDNDCEYLKNLLKDYE